MFFPAALFKVENKKLYAQFRQYVRSKFCILVFKGKYKCIYFLVGKLKRKQPYLQTFEKKEEKQMDFD